MKSNNFLVLLLVLSVYSAYSQETLFESQNSQIDVLFIYGDKVIFINGNDLYESDGTLNGTSLIHTFKSIGSIIRTPNYLYSFIFDPTSDSYQLIAYSLFKREEKTISTINFKSFNPIQNSTVSGDKLFFINKVANNFKLWVTDYENVKDLGVTLGEPDFYGQVPIERMISFNNKLLLNKITEADTSEIWSLDTANLTYKKIAFFYSNLLNYPHFPFNNYINQGDVIYFSGFTGTDGIELWKTDGTSEGTKMVKDLLEGAWQYNNSAKSSDPQSFVLSGSQIYFTTENGSHLWSLDPSTDAITLIDSCEQSYCYNNLKAFNNKIAFIGKTQDSLGFEPWIATTTETNLAGDIWQGLPSSVDAWYTRYHVANDKAFFLADNGINGSQLWYIDRIDGLAKSALDTFHVSIHSQLLALTKVNEKLVFSISDSHGSKLYGVNYDQLSGTLPQPQLRIPANYWFQTIGSTPGSSSNFHRAYNYDLSIAPNNDIILCGVFDGNQLLFYDNNIATPFRYNHGSGFVSRFNSQGELLWNRETSTNSMFFAKKSAVASDQNGHTIYASNFSPYNDFIDLNSYEKGYRLYVTKLDEQGNQVWLTGAFSQNDIEVSNILTDANNNIFLSGLYFGFQYRFGNSLLTSNQSPNYFIQKLDQNGNAVWAKNIKNAWDHYGNIVSMKFDQQTEKIYLLITEGTNYTVSSCEFQPWKVLIICLTLDGDELWRTEIETSDLSVGTDLAVLKNGDVLVVGYFRGKLLLKNFSLMSPRSNDCHLTRPFFVRLNSIGTPLYVKTDSIRWYPSNIENLSDGSFLITGTQYNEKTRPYPGIDSWYPNGTRQVAIRQYSFSGLLKGERFFNTSRLSYMEDSYPFLRVDHDSNIVFTDRSLGKYDSIPYSIFNESNENIILTRFNLNDLKSIASEQPLVGIFPNPVNNRISIIVPGITSDVHLTIYDLNGKIITTTSLTAIDGVFYYDTLLLQSGLYAFRVQYENGSLTRRILVEK